MKNQNGIHESTIGAGGAVILPPHILKAISAGPGTVIQMAVYENRILISAETTQCQLCGNDVSILPMLFNGQKICYQCNKDAIMVYMKKLKRHQSEEIAYY